MKHISKESWTADIGIDEPRLGDYTIMVTNEKSELIATVHGKTIKQARERADAIAELPDLIDEKF